MRGAGRSRRPTPPGPGVSAQEAPHPHPERWISIALSGGGDRTRAQCSPRRLTPKFPAADVATLRPLQQRRGRGASPSSRCRGCSGRRRTRPWARCKDTPRSAFSPLDDELTPAGRRPPSSAPRSPAARFSAAMPAHCVAALTQEKRVHRGAEACAPPRRARPARPTSRAASPSSRRSSRPRRDGSGGRGSRGNVRSETCSSPS